MRIPRKRTSRRELNFFGAFRGHFEVTLSISTSNFMCDACVMHTCTGLVGPKRGKVKKLSVFKSIFEGVKGATGNLAPAAVERAGPFWGHFGNTLASLWNSSGVALVIWG